MTIKLSMSKNGGVLLGFPIFPPVFSWLRYKFEQAKRGVLLTMKVISWQSSLFPENDIRWTLALWVKEN